VLMRWFSPPFVYPHWATSKKLVEQPVLEHSSGSVVAGHLWAFVEASELASAGGC
jgi:hypothetical protein